MFSIITRLECVDLIFDKDRLYLLMLVETNVSKRQPQGSGWLERATSDVSQTLC